tara:strand:- start:98229 stop:99023 length:795 start_codon:yes stop_codon:yes gene_type:complete
LNDLLDIQGLKFSWGENIVLEDISLKLGGGELVAVLGVNGAGKSTFLKCINRILLPDEGTIRINGNEVSAMDLMDLSRATSYVPQSVRTSFPLDVFDVVMLGRRPYISWLISDEDRKKVSDTLSYLGLEKFAFRRFDKLSGGERQRVVIAKAVAQDPLLFLLDEPTSDLDLQNQISTMKSISSIVYDGTFRKSAIIAIHDINIAARFATRIVLLHEGRIIADGSPPEVLTEENIATVFRVSCDIITNHEEGGYLRVIVKDEIQD